MSIKTKLSLSLIVSLILIIIVSIISFFRAEEFDHQINENILIGKIIKDIGELRLLTFDYLYHPEERAKIQWIKKHTSLTTFLKGVSFDDKEKSIFVERMRVNNEQIGGFFAGITASSKSAELRARLSEQLIIRSQEIISNAYLLSDRSDIEMKKAQENARVSVSITLLILTLVITISLVIIYKNIVDSLINLQEGIDVIGKGNLDYRITAKRKDEIGQIANSFNDMTTKIKSSYEDIKKAKQELVKFQMAVEDASDQIIISDSNGIVVYVNKTTEKITGYSIKEILGKKAGSLWGGLMEPSFYENMWKTIKKGNIFMGELTNKRKNGETYITEIHISPLLDRNKNILFFVSIERDISKLKEIDRAKSEFVSVASHALRTPLGIEKWYLESLMKKKYLKNAPKLVRSYLKEVYSSNERLLVLVRNLLNVSRIDQGKVHDDPKNTNIATLIKDVIKTMKILARKKNVTISFTMLTKTNISLFIEPLKLHEIMENLISNAVKYSNQHEEINVILDKKDDALVIQVKDTGIGVSKKDEERIFTKFFRGENAIIKNTEGSGLGLYTTKLYVEEWGGKISVTSAEGKGSTFSIVLPMKIENKKNDIGKEVDA